MIPANAMFLASTLNVPMRRSRLRLSIVQLAARPDRSMECRRTAVDQGGALGPGNSARLSFRQEQTAVLFRFDARAEDVACCISSAEMPVSSGSDHALRSIATLHY